MGYVIQFDPYQGAKLIQRQAKSKTCWGLGESVVLDLISELPQAVPFHFYFDNFFTDLRLVIHLGDHGFGATGTIRTNRIEKCPIDVKRPHLQDGRDKRVH